LQQWSHTITPLTEDGALVNHRFELTNADKTAILFVEVNNKAQRRGMIKWGLSLKDYKWVEEEGTSTLVWKGSFGNKGVVGKFVIENGEVVLKPEAAYGTDLGISKMTWEPSITVDGRSGNVTVLDSISKASGYGDAYFVFDTTHYKTRYSDFFWDPAIGIDSPITVDVPTTAPTGAPSSSPKLDSVTTTAKSSDTKSEGVTTPLFAGMTLMIAAFVSFTML
jgi:hypothetical protein